MAWICEAPTAFSAFTVAVLLCDSLELLSAKLEALTFLAALGSTESKAPQSTESLQVHHLPSSDYSPVEKICFMLASPFKFLLVFPE